MMEEEQKSYELFIELMERANEYWLHEGGNNWPHIDIDRVVQCITSDDLEWVYEACRQEPEPEINVDAFLPKHVRES
jgi:hypothetical protein